MRSTELKSEIHQLIDSVNNDFLLNDLYNELRNILKISSEGIWQKLTDEQKRGGLLSLHESDDDKNLLSNEEVMSRYRKWLTE